MVAERIPLAAIPGGQWDFIMSQEKYVALVGGRGSGKTVASAIKAFIRCGNEAGIRGLLCCSTYVMIRDLMLPAMRKKFGELEGKIWEFKRADMEIRFVNGSVILLRATEDPQKLLGHTLGFFGMDEVRIGDQHQAFMDLQACLRQEGYFQQGWVTTTPHYRWRWIRDRWPKHGTPVNPLTRRPLPSGQYVRYNADTLANPYNPQDYVETLKASIGSERLIAQEIYGEDVEMEGLAFPQFLESVHVRQPPTEMRVKKRVIGVDFGAVRPTACEELCLLEDGRVQGTWEFYQRHCTERQLVEALGSRGSVRIYCDPSGKELIEFLKRNGLSAKAARSNNFALRARLWGSRLNLVDNLPGIYLSSRQANLIAELQSLAYHQARGREYLVDSWEPGLDDHGYDAGAYALMELDAGAIGKPAQIKVDYKGW